MIIALLSTIVRGASPKAAEWEGWTGLAFPESGQYTFPRGLAPVWIDREADRGTYFEPNVWTRHRLGTAQAGSAP